MSSSKRSSEFSRPESGRAIPAVRDSLCAPAPSASVTGPDGETIATVTSTIRPADSGPEAVVSIRGDVDLDTAPLAQETLLQVLDGAERVCLDLTEVRFFGAAGVRVVIAGRLRAATLGRAFRLSGVHGMTARVLALTGQHPDG